jgi:hypothetical protein
MRRSIQSPTVEHEPTEPSWEPEALELPLQLPTRPERRPSDEDETEPKSSVVEIELA